jgi:anaerobic magnesium-protoporphyrin IX monomethyl ester cyclase
MNITLITPSSPNISAFGARSLSSYLKGRGHAVQVVTLSIVPDTYRNRNGFLYAKKYEYSDRIINQTIEVASKSDLIGISFMTQYFNCAVQLTKAIRERLSVPVIWGGVHPTVRPEECLAYADMICIGEGEEALAELAERMEKGQDYSDIANLSLVRNNKIIHNPPRPLIQDLDALPWLDYGPENHFVRDLQTDNLVPFSEEYFTLFMATVPYYKNIPLKSFMYFTTRGCPYNCSYCVNDFYRKIYGAKGFVRKLSVERVVKELENVKMNHPSIEEIEFCDDNFALRTVSEIEQFAALYKKKIGLPFQLLLSPQNITEEKILPLLDAGLIFVETGIQSVAEKTKELYQRSLEEDKLLTAARILNKYRNRMAPPCYHLILDNPFENIEDTLETFYLTLKLPRPFWFKRSSLVAFPETLIHHRYAAAGLINDEQAEIYSKILEMPSTTYINFLFLLNNQNYPIWMLKLLSRRGIVNCFTGIFWIPFWGMAENGIRLVSKIAKLLLMVARGDWGAIQKRVAMIGKMSKGVASSKPPAF